MSHQKHNDRSSNPPRIPKRNASTNGKTEGEPPLPSQPPRPTNDNREDWRSYWQALNQPWRTEPEISKERQEGLARRRATPVDVEKGIYPFKGMKLGRADVEWLLAIHDSGRGPVQWEDVTQRDRKGLDLRGANLQLINLTRLPLAKMRGGLSDEEWLRATVEQREMATIHLEGANLRASHLEGSALSYAHLEGIDLQEAHLEGADLYRVHFGGRRLLRGDSKPLKEENLLPTTLPSADLRQVFFDAETKLAHVSMYDEKYVGVRLVDVHWGGVNLSSIDWESIKMLRDTDEAKMPIYRNGQEKTNSRRLRDYERATRANRQLAAALQAQGLNEGAARFAYRSNVLQRRVYRYQIFVIQARRNEDEAATRREVAKKWFVALRQRLQRFGSYIFSLFLDVLAGYGYKPERTVGWYLLVVLGFALSYNLFGHLPFWPDALVYSLTSFHGRGFLPNLDGQIVTLHYPLVVMAAFEAVIGLLIEISFIATFTQRFFGK